VRVYCFGDECWPTNQASWTTAQSDEAPQALFRYVTFVSVVLTRREWGISTTVRNFFSLLDWIVMLHVKTGGRYVVARMLKGQEAVTLQ
jgi:hypothetical protein